MQKYFLFGTFFCFNLILHAQIKFEKKSFNEIVYLAKAENKLIFLQLESGTCSKCNEVADHALLNPALAVLQNSFVFLKLNATQPERIKIDKDYNTAKVAGTLFFTSEGILISRYLSTSSSVDTYLDQANLALRKNTEPDNIGSLQKQYDAGNREISFLEKYITKRNELNLLNDDFLNEYVSLIPADSLQSFRVIQFIAFNAPMLGTKADSILRKDRNLFTIAWYRIPLQQRININNRIIYKSKQKAIAEKNIYLLYKVAAFSKSTYDGNNNNGEKSYQKILLDYYEGISDTLKFIEKAIFYYDTFLMAVNVNDIKKSDSIRSFQLSHAAGVYKDTVSTGENSFTVSSAIRFAPSTQLYTSQLNSGAWALYKMSNDAILLKKALEWAKRANEFYDSPEAMDTYARLLYKTKDIQQAINWEQKAIDLQRKRGFNVTEYESVFNSMRKNEKLINE